MSLVHLGRKPIARVAGALAIAGIVGADSARAGGLHGGWCLHGNYAPASYVMGGGTPMVAVSGMNVAGVASSPMMAFMPTASVGYTAAPVSAYVGYTATPAVSLPASGVSMMTRPSAISPVALQAASNYAFSANEGVAQAAEARFPNLANAARSRNFHGGRFVLFLKQLLSTVGPDLTGLATGGLAGLGRTAIRELLSGLTGNLLNLDPQSSGLGPDIEKLIDELLGVGGGGLIGGGNGGGNAVTGAGGTCFTIRVCADANGNVTGTSTGNGSGFASGTGGAGNVGGQNLLPPLVSTAQAPATTDRAEQRHQELLNAIQALTTAVQGRVDTSGEPRHSTSPPPTHGITPSVGPLAPAGPNAVGASQPHAQTSPPPAPLPSTTIPK